MAIAPTILRGNYSDFFGSDMLPVIDEVFHNDLERFPSRRELLFQVRSTDQQISQYGELHDVDLLSQVSEGQAFSDGRIYQGASKTFTPVKYGLDVPISREWIDDGKFTEVGEIVRKMAKSARETQEINAANIFNNGFSTETAADGLSVFNSAHTLPRGSTFRNVLSTAADLSSTSLEQMLRDFDSQFVGDTGIKEMIPPKILLVSENNYRLAKELIGSDLKAETADNNMNSFREEGLQVIKWTHLTDKDAWFMLADPMDTGLRIIQRDPITTEVGPEGVGWKSEAVIYRARYREDLGVTHSKGIFGTAGA